MRKLGLLILVLFLVLGTVVSARAAWVSVDMSGLTPWNSYTYINAIGAKYATAFNGQAYDGYYNLSGSPSNPLTLNPIKLLNVYPYPSNGPNSILPEPGNQGPLSILLDSQADSITWTMGYTDLSNSSVTIDFFAMDGSLKKQIVQSLVFPGYSAYSFSGFGPFAGLSIYNNNDSAGLRYLNFSYNTYNNPVPIPSAIWLLTPGILGLIGLKRKYLG